MSYLETRRNFILNGRPLAENKKYSIKKVSDKRAAKIKEQKENGSDNALDIWFEERRKEMTGRCVLCNGTTLKKDDENYRKSIHHLFDKRPTMFPSVSTHPDNWLELCFYGNSCHTNVHNKTITWELLMDSAEAKLIIDKFKKIYPAIAENERKNIPEILLNELK
jgi:hypothetical protein